VNIISQINSIVIWSLYFGVLRSNFAFQNQTFTLPLKDTLKHRGMRNKLTDVLIAKGIVDPKVLDAIRTIPRHLFMDSGFEGHAYQDKAFPIAADQTISQPYTVAFQTELLAVKPGHKILEIGTGSGYQTAVLLKLKAKVYTIERQLELFKKTNLFFKKMGYRPKKTIFGDGYKGLPEEAPFDSVVVTAGAPEVPKALLSQLKIGGRLVIPVGVDEQIMIMFTRKSETDFERKELGVFKFVPLLEDKN
jgi:protein-L-isoaspartate(D-aspartate) O-methyltransferase